MQITNNNLNFKSKIKFISENEFNRTLMRLPDKAQFVPYPWTIETLKNGCNNLFTREICDCIAGFITNGKENLMFHLMTRNHQQAKADKVKAFDIKNIEIKLKQAINLKDPNIHAIILGGLKSVDNDLDNHLYFTQIQKLFDKYKIPCSIFGPKKDLPMTGFGEYSILYTHNSDTLWITDSRTETLCSGQHEIEVKDDGITYNIYKPIDESSIAGNRISCDNKKRVKTGTEDFFRSRFHEVKLCSFDEFI